MTTSANDRFERARVSLEGLSVGDAFGETFFVNPDMVEGLIAQRALASGTWHYTDDTLMALSIVSVLRQRGRVQQRELARSFAERYERTRGYGAAMHRLLWEVRCGEDWAERAGSLFGGQGSFGNGAAMRVAPLGAFFADDVDAAAEQAALSAVVTHTHEEAVAGAVAVAVAAAQAWRLGRERARPRRSEFLDLVLPSIPESEVDVASDTAICLPVVLDLAERKAVWADIGLKRNPRHVNNVEGNSSQVTLLGKSLTEVVKPDLYNLFRLHAEARGRLVGTQAEADTVFSPERGITPFELERIASEFM